MSEEEAQKRKDLSVYHEYRSVHKAKAIAESQMPSVGLQEHCKKVFALNFQLIDWNKDMNKLPYLPEYKYLWLKTKEGKWIRIPNPHNHKSQENNE